MPKARKRRPMLTKTFKVLPERVRLSENLTISAPDLTGSRCTDSISGQSDPDRNGKAHSAFSTRRAMREVPCR